MAQRRATGGKPSVKEAAAGEGGLGAAGLVVIIHPNPRREADPIQLHPARGGPSMERGSGRKGKLFGWRDQEVAFDRALGMAAARRNKPSSWRQS